MDRDLTGVTAASGRSLRTAWRADAFRLVDVLRLADDRSDADLCLDRNFRACLACCGAHHPGLESRRRIWNERDLPHRDGRRAPPRFLLQLPICDADRWTDLRADRATSPAKSLLD